MKAKSILLFNVAGLKFYSFWNLPEGSLVGKEVDLIPEPANPYDEHAVKVMMGTSQVGHVPRAQTGVIHEAVRLNKKFTATITTHYPRAVVIDVRTEDTQAEDQ